MASKLSGIELTRYDDLFKTDAEREADRQERIQIVPAAEVFPYSRQPYTIDRPTPDLVRLMDSIEHIGIAEPLIVRPRESSGYEIISGHRRDYCAKAVGLDTRPVIVRNYSDEEADILVVDYNINREDLLPSEKAKAYKLKLDAMKRQLNPKLEVDGIVLTMVDSRTTLAREINALVRKTYGGHVFASEIPRSIKAAEISVENKSIYDHDRSGKAALAYENLTREVLSLGKQIKRHRTDPVR